MIRKQTKIKINQREINHKSEEKNMADYETQVVVIAGGPSGLSAAVQAAEDGAEVIVLEKAAAVGGAANMGMGPLGIGTKYQKQQMEDVTVEKAFNKEEEVVVKPEQVRRVLCVMDAVRESAKTGKAIAFEA